jgi:hypothetical protein
MILRNDILANLPPFHFAPDSIHLIYISEVTGELNRFGADVTVLFMKTKIAVRYFLGFRLPQYINNRLSGFHFINRI